MSDSCSLLNRVKVCLTPAYLGGWQQKLWYQDWQDLKEFLAKMFFFIIIIFIKY
jgi:hypothetical protein